jgi:hypothetical protein
MVFELAGTARGDGEGGGAGAGAGNGEGDGADTGEEGSTPCGFFPKIVKLPPRKIVEVLLLL